MAIAFPFFEIVRSSEIQFTFGCAKGRNWNLVIYPLSTVQQPGQTRCATHPSPPRSLCSVKLNAAANGERGAAQPLEGGAPGLVAEGSGTAPSSATKGSGTLLALGVEHLLPPQAWPHGREVGDREASP